MNLISSLFNKNREIIFTENKPNEITDMLLSKLFMQHSELISKTRLVNKEWQKLTDAICFSNPILNHFFGVKLAYMRKDTEQLNKIIIKINSIDLFDVEAFKSMIGQMFIQKIKYSDDASLIPSLLQSQYLVYDLKKTIYWVTKTDQTIFKNLLPQFLDKEKDVSIDLAIQQGHYQHFLEGDPVDPSIKRKVFQSGSKYGHLEVVKILLNDKDIDTENLYSAMCVSAQNGHPHILKLFLEDKSVDPTHHASLLLEKAIDSKCLKSIQLLLEDKRIKPDSTILVKVYRQDNLDIFNLFFKYADFSQFKIQEACRTGDIENLKKNLRDSQIDPTAYNNLALQLASRYGHTEIVQELLKNQRVISKQSINLALQEASTHGQLAIVRLFLNQHYFALHLDYNNALYYACIKGRLDVIKVFLEDQKINLGLEHNILQAACKNGCLDVIRYLLEDQRIIKIEKKHFLSLQHSMQYGRDDIIFLLLEKLNLTSSNKALTLALNYNRTKVIQYLLKKVNLSSENELHCWMWARERQDFETLQFLKRKKLNASFPYTIM